MFNNILSFLRAENILQEFVLVMGIIITFALIGRLLLYFLSNTMLRFTRRTDSQLDDIILEAIKRPVVWGVTWLGVALADQMQTRLLPNPVNSAFRHILFIGFSLIIYVALYRLITQVLDWYLEQKASQTKTIVDDQLVPFIRRSLLVVLSFSVLMVVLQDLGQPIGSLMATLGIGSLAIALAAQETLRDIISGFLILADQRFRLGDRIELLDKNMIGDVIAIGLRSTHILTMDHRVVIIPNSLIGNNMIVNHAYPDPNLRLDLPIRVAYGCEIRHVKAILLNAIRHTKGVHKNRRPDIIFKSFGDWAINLEIRCWIDAYADKPKMIDRINEAAYNALKQANIEIPYPQSTLWHRVEADAIPSMRAMFDKDQKRKSPKRKS